MISEDRGIEYRPQSGLKSFIFRRERNIRTRMLSELVKRVVRQKETDKIALPDNFRALRLSAVQDNILFPQHPVEKTLRSAGQELCKILVEALSRFVLLYSELFHVRLPVCCSHTAHSEICVSVSQTICSRV